MSLLSLFIYSIFSSVYANILVMRRDDILSALINTIVIPFILVWRLIMLIAKGIKRIVIDMLKHIYGKIIAGLVVLMFIYIVTTLFR